MHPALYLLATYILAYVLALCISYVLAEEESNSLVNTAEAHECKGK